MKPIVTTACCVAFLVCFSFGKPGLAEKRPRRRFSVPAPQKGTVEVPVDHGRRGRTRKLHFHRFTRANSAKRPMMFLHGGPGAPVPIARILESPFGDTVLRHFDLVYFDQRGAGRSLTEAEKRRGYVIRSRTHYRTRQYVEDVEALRRHFFGDKQVTIVGSSWGGFLGIAYALKYPTSVKALVLGSFAATGRYAANFCTTFDRKILQAESQHPSLRDALGSFRKAIEDSKIVWRRGTKQQRLLKPSDAIEVILPFAMKAKYAQMAEVLKLIVKGDPKGLKFLDQLDIEKGETATAGGSLPGEATLCQVFADRTAFLNLQRSPPSATYCNNRAVAKSFLKLCKPYFSRKELFNVERDLPRIKTPTLVFAGQWDPVLEWQTTLRVALGLPNATFVLINGGHTPVNAGGTCFANALDAFVNNKKMKLSCFVSHWP